MRVLVTGFGGFIGSTFSHYLSDSGFDVIALSSTVQTCVISSSLTILNVDYSDVDELTRSLKNVDVVVHLAALAHKPEFLYKPTYFKKFFLANVQVSLNLITASARARIKRFVFVSSIAVYGSSFVNTSANNGSEYDSFSPDNNYSISKLVVESFLPSIASLSNFDFVIIRPPLVYSKQSPGNLNLLICLFRLIPFNLFSSLTDPKYCLSLASLMEVLELSCSHPGVANKSFNIADKEPVSISSIARQYYGNKRFSSFSLRIPRSLFKFLLVFFGFKSVWVKLSSSILIDSTPFSDITGWSPLELNTPPVSIRDIFSEG